LKQPIRCFSFINFLFITSLIILTACNSVTPPTVQTDFTPTVSEAPTQKLVSIESITPTRTTSPSETKKSTQTSTISPSPTITISPTFPPTINAQAISTKLAENPCQLFSGCMVSPNKQWETPAYRPLDDLKIINASKGIQWTVTTDELFRSSTDSMGFIPLQFDRQGRWLYAILRPKAAIDGGPTIYGVVKIELDTGKVTTVLQRNYYYGVKFSQDETKLAYIADQAVGCIDLENNREHFYSLDFNLYYQVTWSPDGTQFAVAERVDLFDIPHENPLRVLIVSPGGTPPIKTIFSYPVNISIEKWDSYEGLVLSSNYFNNTQNMNDKLLWKIDPVHPTPILLPKPTRSPSYTPRPNRTPTP
jgi:hypothetical protein